MAERPSSVRPKRTVRERTPISDWLLSGLLMVGLGVCLAGLNALLGGVDWWFQAAFVGLMVLLAGAIARSVARHPLWGSLAAAMTGVAVITAMFASETAILFVIPTADTFPALHILELQGMVSISEQDVPATATPGITYLICVGVAATAAAMDLAAQGLRQPALAGIPMAILLIVPSLVRSYLSDAWIFVLAAVVYVAILLVRRSKSLTLRGAFGLAGVALVVSLFTPLTLASSSTSTTGGTSGLTTGVNPIISLGDDLRRGEPDHAITYTTTDNQGQYLRLAVLEDFSGRDWEPTSVQTIPGNDIEAIGPPAGVTAPITIVPITTTISVDNVLSRWLPAPYAPTSVRGLEGDWSWEPDGLAIRTDRSNARGQDYEVDSILIQPSVDQLIAAGVTVTPGLEELLDVPDDLPAVVAETALEVVGGAVSNYERALALQEYFTGGEFTYSEDAPVEDGYDGSGAAVLGPFLEKKSGYCVHFSSAMAAMARTLGIPARVAVGFTPGTVTTIAEAGGVQIVQYDVTTFDLHAWPELWFDGIGWVRFEPTPGRGVQPVFAQLAEDDPSTPDVDESVPEPPAPIEPLPSTSAAPALPDEIDPGATPETVDAAATSPAVWLGPLGGGAVLLLLLTPFIIRTARRSRRLSAVDDGSAAEGWAEVRDTAADLGWRTTDTLTPRQLGDDLGDLLDSNGARMVAAVRSGVERESYGGLDSALTGDDVTKVLRLLRREAGLWRRIVATFAPVSLAERWLPAPTERLAANSSASAG